MKSSLIIAGLVSLVFITSLLPSLSWACGCTYDPPGGKGYPHYLFETNWGDHETATLRWKKKLYKLKLISKKETKTSKPGSKSTHDYSGVASPIQVTVTAIQGKRTCQGSECESSPYKAKISITLEGRTETVAVLGDCGC